MQKFEKIKIVIIGGGYTGISCAIELLKHNFKVTLIEANANLGGLGKTVKLSSGAFCEAYYHNFFTHDKYLINYCKEYLGEHPEFNSTKMAIYSDNTFFLGMDLTI